MNVLTEDERYFVEYIMAEVTCNDYYAHRGPLVCDEVQAKAEDALRAALALYIVEFRNE